MNKVFVSGNLTRDPELRYTPNNIAVCNFGMANNIRRGQDKEDITTFLDVEAFGKLAEIINDRGSKGSQCHLQGRLKLDQWETKDGQKRSRLKIIAEEVDIAQKNGNGGNSSKNSSNGAEPDSEDDIPF